MPVASELLITERMCGPTESNTSLRRGVGMGSRGDEAGFSAAAILERAGRVMGEKLEKVDEHPFVAAKSLVGGGMFFLMLVTLSEKKDKNSSHLAGDGSWMTVGGG